MCGSTGGRVAPRLRTTYTTSITAHNHKAWRRLGHRKKNPEGFAFWNNLGVLLLWAPFGKKEAVLMVVENIRGHKLQQRDCSRLLLLKSAAAGVGAGSPPYPPLTQPLTGLVSTPVWKRWMLLASSSRIPSSLNVTGPSMSTEAEAVLRLSHNYWTITLASTDLTVDLHEPAFFS